MARRNGTLTASMRVNGKRIRSMEKVYTHGKMAESMMVLFGIG